MTHPLRDNAKTSSPAASGHALPRRGLLIGAGAVGAAALAAKALPGAAPAAPVAAVAKAAVDTTGGYQVSAHVLRYYETTRA